MEGPQGVGRGKGAGHTVTEGIDLDTAKDARLREGDDTREGVVGAEDEVSEHTHRPLGQWAAADGEVQTGATARAACHNVRLLELVEERPCFGPHGLEHPSDEAPFFSAELTNLGNGLRTRVHETTVTNRPRASRCQGVESSALLLPMAWTEQTCGD